jgi:hypothetical protein
MLFEHGYRSYMFARALGTVERLECDDEALFAAAVLHDHAFSVMDTLSDRCFTLAGAEVAEQVLAASSLSRQSKHDALDAITLHLNPVVGPERARCSTSCTTGSSSTSSARGRGSSTRKASPRCNGDTRGTASRSAGNHCCEDTGNACAGAAPARCSRSVSALRSG